MRRSVGPECGAKTRSGIGTPRGALLTGAQGRMRHSTSVDGLRADYRIWAGTERIDAREFEGVLAALGGVRVWGHAVVVGVVLHF